jgi:hypothetical protein
MMLVETDEFDGLTDILLARGAALPCRRDLPGGEWEIHGPELCVRHESESYMHLLRSRDERDARPDRCACGHVRTQPAEPVITPALDAR